MVREGNHSPHRGFLPARAAQLRVGPVPNINCPDERASPYLALFLQGKPWRASLSLGAIPPGTAPFLPEAKTSQSLPGTQSAALRSAGAESGGQCIRAAGGKISALPYPDCLLPATHCAWKHRQCKAYGQNLFPPTQPCYGPSRPRPRRESGHRTRCRSLPAAGSLRSPVRCPVKARHASPARHSPGSTLHCVPRH